MANDLPNVLPIFPCHSELRSTAYFSYHNLCYPLKKKKHLANNLDF